MPERFVMKPDAVAVLLPYMTGSSAKVFDWLCANRDFKDDTVSFGLRLIGEEVGVTDMRTLSASIAQLIEFGLLAVIREGHQGRGGRAVWRIVFDVDSPAYTKAIKERDERRKARENGGKKGVITTPYNAKRKGVIVAETGDGNSVAITPLEGVKGVTDADKRCNPCAQKVELVQHGIDSLPDSFQNTIPAAADATADGGAGDRQADVEPSGIVTGDPTPPAGTPETPPAAALPTPKSASAGDLPVRPESKPRANRAKPAKSAKAKPPTGDHAAVTKRFCDGWQGVYGPPYPFAGGKDGAHVKSILSHAGSVAKALGIVDAYLGDRDRFLTNARHPLGLLVSRLPRYVAGDVGDADDEETPVLTAEKLFSIYGHDEGDGIVPWTWDQCVDHERAQLQDRGKVPTR